MYSITEVSRRLHVHSQTLRNWERKGLLKPRRFGLMRVFSDQDLERCETIKKYSRRGVSLGSILNLLHVSEARSESSGNGGGK
jgi:MerR family transcriptional regulator, heat shock protein HspR